MDNTIPQRKSTRLKYFDYSTIGAYFITICTRDRMKILSEITRENPTSTNITNDLQPVGEKTHSVEVGARLLAGGVFAPPAKRPIECSPTALNSHQDMPCAVGEGLAPPAGRTPKCDLTALNSHQDTPCAVGEGLAPPAERTRKCDLTALNSHQDTPCAVGEVLAPPAERTRKCDLTALNSHQDTPCVVGEVLAPPATKLSKIGELVEEQMSDLEERYKNILIDEYVIMPDHIHMIILIKNTGGASTSPTMNDVIRTYKSLTSRICKQRFGIEKLFQRSFYDHVIRNQKDYETRKKYILENPIKWYYYQVYEDE